MPQISEMFVFWLAIATQVAGVASVVVARLSERSWGGAAVQRTFFICLVAVGLSTILVIGMQPGTWLTGAATLGLMAVGATLDFGSSSRTAPEC